MRSNSHTHGNSHMHGNLHMHGEVECTRKHGRRAFKNHRYRTRRYKKGGGTPAKRHRLSVSNSDAFPRVSVKIAPRNQKFNEHGTPLELANTKFNFNLKEFGVANEEEPSKEFSTSALPKMVQLTPAEEAKLDEEMEAERAAKAAKRNLASTHGGSRKRRRGPVGKK